MILIIVQKLRMINDCAISNTLVVKRTLFSFNSSGYIAPYMLNKCANSAGTFAVIIFMYWLRNLFRHKSSSTFPSSLIKAFSMLRLLDGCVHHLYALRVAV